MFDNSKFDGNEECSLNKDLLELDGKLTHIEDWNGRSTKGLACNYSSTHLEGDNSIGSTHTLRTYLNNFEDDYEPFTSYTSGRDESAFGGRLTRSLSVMDAKNDYSYRFLEPEAFQNVYSNNNSKQIFLPEKEGSVLSPSHEFKNKDIKFHEINYNSKLDKDNFKNNEIISHVKEVEKPDNIKEIEGFDPASITYKCYSPKSFESSGQKYSVNKSGGGCLIKTPTFFKTTYSEEAPTSNNDSIQPSVIQINQFENGPHERSIHSSIFIQDQNASYGFTSYKIIEKDLIQSNSLFRNRNVPHFPFNTFKKRSYSEADLNKSNMMRNKIQNSFSGDEDLMSLYKKGKFSRSSSDSCIDPRTFYKNENHTRIFHTNKENLVKPNHSYAQIITRAISSSSDEKLSLGEIYKWIEENFEYYRYANPVWKNSIRHNLSLSKCFKKVPREPGSRGKGGKWMIDKEYLYLEENKKKRRSYGEENDMYRNSVEEKSMDPNGYLRNNITAVDYSKFSENKYDKM